jgi:hypothetical protein
MPVPDLLVLRPLWLAERGDSGWTMAPGLPAA